MGSYNLWIAAGIIGGAWILQVMLEYVGENCYARLKSKFRAKYIQCKVICLVVCYQPDKIWTYLSCHYQVSYLDLNMRLDLPARKSGRGARGSSCSCLAVRKATRSLGSIRNPLHQSGTPAHLHTTHENCNLNRSWKLQSQWISPHLT